MAKGPTHTRKKSDKGMTVPDLRRAFDHIEQFAAKHPSDVDGFRALWKKTFGKPVSKEAAADYLAFAREEKPIQKGGAMPFAGAPLDYTLRAGTSTPYGNFPPYVVSGFQYQGQDSQTLTPMPTLTPPATLGTNTFPDAFVGKQSGGKRTRRSKGSGKTRKQRGGALPSLSTAVSEMLQRPFGMGAPPNAAQDAQMLAKGVDSLSSPRPEIPGPFVTGASTSSPPYTARVFTPAGL